ncbi:MAG: hypothetical protein WC807_01265 [Hyphomicrobium sp.]|jgi:hypothetical protein
MVAIAAWGIVSIAVAVLAGFLASVKNRDISFWMAWCFLVPPLVIWLLLLPKRVGPRPRRATLDDLDRQDSFL